MQYETSITHSRNTAAGLTVEWVRTMQGANRDQSWDVVCYSDGSRWLFDNGSAEKLTLIGTVKDGLNYAEILETSSGAIVALYESEVESFSDREAWIGSMADSDKPEAESILNR